MNAEKLKALILKASKALPDFDAIVDMFDSKPVYASEKVLKLIGYNMEELSSANSKELYPNPDDTRAQLMPAVYTKRKGEFSSEVRKKNGEIIRVKSAYVIINLGLSEYYVAKVLGSELLNDKNNNVDGPLD